MMGYVHTCYIFRDFDMSRKRKNPCSARFANITSHHWGDGNAASLGRCGLCRNKTVIKHEDRV